MRKVLSLPPESLLLTKNMDIEIIFGLMKIITMTNHLTLEPYYPLIL